MVLRDNLIVDWLFIAFFIILLLRVIQAIIKIILIWFSIVYRRELFDFAKFLYESVKKSGKILLRVDENRSRRTSDDSDNQDSDSEKIIESGVGVNVLDYELSETETECEDILKAKNTTQAPRRILKSLFIASEIKIEINRFDSLYSKNQSDEEKIREIIKEELKNGSNLHKIRLEVSRGFGASLNLDDSTFVANESISICSLKWFESCVESIDSIFGSTDSQKFKVLLDIVKDFTDFSSCHHILTKSKYFNFLQENLSLILPDDARRLIRDLKSYVHNLLTDLNSSIKHELNFIDLLSSYLTTSYENFKKLENLSNDQENLSLKIVLAALRASLTESSAFVPLVNVIQILSSSETFELEEAILSFIKEFIKPPIIKRKFVDNRWILEVIGKNVSLAVIKSRLEQMLDAEVEEVRFVGSEIFYVDSDLSLDNLWHGKNIVLFARKIRVTKNVEWNVSGRNSKLCFTVEPQIDSNGDGGDGDDGAVGESGGNVLIIADEIFESTKWQITSNGGTGSIGQNGGNAKDGEDGCGMPLEKFRELAWNQNQIRWLKAFFKIKKEIESYGDPFKYVNGKWTKDVFDMLWGKWYIEFQSDEGYTVLECVNQNYFVIGCSRHLIRMVKGTTGTPGGKGGAGGFGGNGGVSGDIQILIDNQHIESVKNEGQNGKDGTAGLDGYNGCDGYDLGYYADFTSSRYYGEDRNSKLSLKHSSTSNGWTVNNPKFNGEQYSEIWIDRSIVKNSRSNKQKSSKQKIRDKKAIAIATRKKTTVSQQILAEYETLFKSNFNDWKAEQEQRLRKAQIILDNTKESDEMKEETNAVYRRSMPCGNISSTSESAYFSYREIARGPNSFDMLKEKIAGAEFEDFEDFMQYLRYTEMTLPQLQFLQNTLTENTCLLK